MLGKVRPSSCSADSLERPPPKILKDDSLSIYEATLMKLKLGSRRDLSSPSEEAMKMEGGCSSASISTSSRHSLSSTHEEAMTIDTSVSLGSSDCQSMGSFKQQQNQNVSVLYLFSKYESSRHALSSPHEEAVMIENGRSSAGISSSSSICQSTGSTKQQLEHECISSLPVLQM
ncbi:hypothetical protein L1049_027479 [Liquidambar formosana]|uniref:Uncharacterized protein n=1 Tax=Liquidambar formosana TaxID=63359 RepID=A0AAP0RIR5_LIQFO